MKFIFFGTPEFAAIILEKLIKAGFIPEAVVCNPDKPVGRKKIITKPPTKILAEKYNIKVYQPEKLEIGEIKPDFAIVAAYAKIITKEILDIPRLGTIGVHPSLLPKYRGATPIQTAILNGDKETGTTLFIMDEKIDNGPIIARRQTQIANRNYKELEKELAESSAKLLIETLPNIENKIKNASPQDESLAAYTKKIKTTDAYIEPNDLKTAENNDGKIALIINRKIRAFNPEPGAWTIINNKRTKLLESEITANGKLKLKKIQTESKKQQKI